MSNIFLNNFNIESNIGLPVKGIFFYLSFMRSCFLLTNANPMNLIYISAIPTIFILIFLYIFFLRKFEGNTKIKYIVAIIYPIFSIIITPSYWFAYVLNFSMILLFIISYILFYKDKSNLNKEFIILNIICWIALGLYWHSFQVLTFLIIFFFFLIIFSESPKSIKLVNSYFSFFIFFIIFIIIWFYLREQTLIILSSISEFNIDFFSLFSKGSFTGQYSFQTNNKIFEYFDFVRYFGYISIFVILGILTIKYFLIRMKKERISKCFSIIICLFFAEIGFMVLYFIETKTTAPRILSIFLFPIFLIILLSNQNHLFNNKIFNNKIINNIVLLILILSLIVSIPYSINSYFNETAEKNITFDSYSNSLNWIIKNLNDKQIISDAHSNGNFLLLFTSKGYIERNPNLKFKVISDHFYKKIVESKIELTSNEIFIYNYQLFKKHLYYESLEYWNKYEPIKPYNLEKNQKISPIYSDGKIIIYK